MTSSAHPLASGPGWRVDDVVCTAGPHERPFEEAHESFCIAAVVEGTFQYRSSRGCVTLAPGPLMLGNAGDCFECGHAHAAGDRCLSFHFAPEAMEEILRDVPGVRRLAFPTPRVPPLPALMTLVAAAEAARDGKDAATWKSWRWVSRERLRRSQPRGAPTARLACMTSAASPQRCDGWRLGRMSR